MTYAELKYRIEKARWEEKYKEYEEKKNKEEKQPKGYFFILYSQL